MELSVFQFNITCNSLAVSAVKYRKGETIDGKNGKT